MFDVIFWTGTAVFSISIVSWAVLAIRTPRTQMMTPTQPACWIDVPGHQDKELV